MMKLPFDRIEARLQALIEGSLSRLFPPTRSRTDLSTRLVDAMRANLHQEADGSVWAPNLFTISLSPAKAGSVERDWTMLDELAQIVLQAGSENGLQFPLPPVVHIQADPALGEHEMNVEAAFNWEGLEETSTLAVSSEPFPGSRIPGRPANAFLIVGGRQTYPLERSVINIGRNEKNDLVLDDPRISREHAQIRAVQGRFQIFDLESTAGTYVNDQLITQTVLHPGDVISLGGISLIYGEDPPASEDATQEYVPPDSDLD